MTIIRLEAWCDHVTEDEYRDQLARSQLPPVARAEALEDFKAGLSFRVQEYAVMSDGRRLALGPERGWSTGRWFATGGGAPPNDQWAWETLETLEGAVRCTVLPDEDPTEDEHPWEFLVERLRDHGVDASREELEQLPYEVVFSDRVRARVAK